MTDYAVYYEAHPMFCRGKHANKIAVIGDHKLFQQLKKDIPENDFKVLIHVSSADSLHGFRFNKVMVLGTLTERQKKIFDYCTKGK